MGEGAEGSVLRNFEAKTESALASPRACCKPEGQPPKTQARLVKSVILVPRLVKVNQDHLLYICGHFVLLDSLHRPRSRLEKIVNKMEGRASGETIVNKMQVGFDQKQL